MKRILIFSAAFAVCCTISSCKKDTSASNSSTGSLPKTVTEDVTSSGLGHQVDTENLTYDVNNRQVSMVSVTSPGSKVLYQYNANHTFTLDLYLSNQLNIHALYWLNANGFVDSCLQYNNTQDTSTTKYIYNDAKQLVQQREYDFSTLSGSSLTGTDTYSYDGNGNVIQDIGDNQTTTFDYYADVNTLSLGQPYLSQTKNLIKTMTITPGGTITHTYTFDSNKRLTVDSAFASDGGIDVKTYTY